MLAPQVGYLGFESGSLINPCSLLNPGCNKGDPLHKVVIKIAYKDNYSHPLWDNHPFPMEKYELLAQQIRHEGLVENDRFFVPQAVSEEDILLTHCSDYWARLKNLEITEKAMKKVGFPLSRELVDRELDITGGTVQLAEWALEWQDEA